MKSRKIISMFSMILMRFRIGIRYILVAMSVIGLSTGLIACGGGGSSSSDNSLQTGEVLIGLTDAPGDFQTYTVDVVSLTLTKANGAVIETLPVQTTVDFSQYTEMTEFLTAATVPSGIYTKASMILDYSNADIQVENGVGDTVPVSMVKDEEGNDITIMELRVQLEGRSQLRIAPGIPANLTLDFDLKASNQVDFNAAGDPTVTVEPFLIADVNLERNKTHRLRGALKKVNPDEEYYDVIVRPFHHRINDRDDRFGAIRVKTNSETLYDIDLMSYEGAEGLRVLNSMPAFTATVALGEIKFNPRRFEATHVYAGSSVPGGDKDVVHGNVIQRVDNSLIVKGATLVRRDGSAIFRDSITVQLAESTTVRRQQSRGAFSIADISVGQRVSIFGTLTNEDPLSLELDATEGHVNMQFTTLRGRLNTNLQNIDRRGIDLFDFTGTGSTPVEDADPSAYEIDTGLLDISSIINGSSIKALGFVRPFGMAPADFEARTLVDVSNVKGHLGLTWDPATAAPFVDVLASGLTLNLQGQGRFHNVVRAGVRFDLNSLDQNPVLQPLDSGEGNYVLHIGDIVELFTRFENYIDALNEHIAKSHTFRGVRAIGLFDESTGIMKAEMISIRVKSN